MKLNKILLLILSANITACNNESNTMSSDVVSKKEIEKINTNIIQLYPKADANLKKDILNVAIESLESMVFIKGGSFMMGDFKAPCNTTDLEKMDWTSDASCNTALSMTTTGANNLHKVTLSSYSLSNHETTYYETDAFNLSENKPRARQNIRNNKKYPIPDEQLQFKPSPTKSWQEAKNYCLWLGKITGYPIDLPTEAQWEYAARNRGKNIYYATNNGYVQRIGSNYISEDGSIQEYTKEQGNYGDFGDIKRWPPNPLGLYDMAGNSGEWVNDWYSKNYYKESPVLDPQGPKTGTEKVTRGWGGSMPLTTARSYEKTNDSNYYSRRGFRCAVQQTTPINKP
ncbi:formylglycine-generating enzyme family protein [Photobacterium piscicola]|uniref:formylglycine-generating enzyme family protein n=1 Tax=Photobacterium piscicola TaxID=1378299 RepID=UPI003735A245